MVRIKSMKIEFNERNWWATAVYFMFFFSVDTLRRTRGGVYVHLDFRTPDVVQCPPIGKFYSRKCYSANGNQITKKKEEKLCAATIYLMAECMHTLLPASSFNRHDGRRSLDGGGWYDVGDDGFECDVFLMPFSLSETSAYLLASLRNLSANDSELALSNSNSVRCLFVAAAAAAAAAAAVLLTAAVWILSFLSSSVMPNAMTLSFVRSASIGLDTVVFSAIGDTFWFVSALFLEKLKLIWTFDGDTFGASMSKSVFFVFVAVCVDRVGTFIVTDADVFDVFCCCDGVGIVNDAIVRTVSAFDAADNGAVIVYDATTVSVDELVGMDTAVDTLATELATDDVAVTLSSDDDFIVGTRSLVVVAAVVVVVVVAVLAIAEFSF